MDPLGKLPLLLLALLLAAGGGVRAAADPAAAPEPEPESAASWMGVILGDALDGGVQLVAIVPGGPAAQAGLRRGDIVVQADGSELLDVDDLTRLLEARRPGGQLRLELLRAGRALERAVRLRERPPAPTLFRPAAPAAPEPPPAPAAPGVRSYGLRLVTVTPDLRRHYGAPDDAGLLVTGIDPQRPAADDGLRVGDVIVHVAGEPLRDPGQLDLLFLEGAPELPASLVRAGVRTEVTLRTRRAVDAALAAAEAAPAPDGRHRALEQSLRKEMERLEKRLEELRSLLEEAEED